MCATWGKWAVLLLALPLLADDPTTPTTPPAAANTTIPAVPEEAEGPLCPPRTNCTPLYNVSDEYFYRIEGVKLKIAYKPLDYFKLTCPENVSLESEALPRFPANVTVPRLTLEACAPPGRGYAQALRALGLRARDSLQLTELPAGALRAAQLAGLPVRALRLAAASAARPRALPGLLAALPALLDLRLAGVALPPDELLRLPAGLKALELDATGLGELPAAALARLPALRTLVLREPALASAPDLASAAALAHLELAAPVDGVTLGPALENVTLVGARALRLRGSCGALVRLLAVSAERAPAAGWLRGCARLEELRLLQLRGALPAGALRGAAALRLLVVSASPSLALPKDLLADAPALQSLELIGNGLDALPGNLFSAPLTLVQLDLSENNLTAATIGILAAFKSLEKLNLENNPLGDLCESSKNYITNGLSPLRALRALQRLQLAGCGASRACRDWRQLPRLQLLDLRRNRITELQFEDLQWVQAKVDLRDNPIEAIYYGKEDYERALAVTAPSAVQVLVDSALACDCRAYWFARALRERPLHAPRPLSELRCAAAGRMRARPLARLVCALPAEACAQGCACSVGGEGVGAWAVCGAARGGELPALAALPALPALPAPLRLLAAHNNLTALPAHLSDNITLVDLSHNRISELEAEAVRALFAAPARRVRLAGNRLACACRQRAALTVLLRYADRVEDADGVQCAGGPRLQELRLGELCAEEGGAGGAGGWLGGALGAAGGALALGAAALAAACLARPSARRRIKMFLLERNLCLGWVLRPFDDDEEDDEERIYDAFVSFSHRDWKFVTEELVARLERGPRARRLCLHYRDWTPGEWIPAQIAASVRRSRRTLVVLSDHFLASTWARAEFREAHAHALRDRRPRLLLLLLHEPSPQRLDPELRAYLAANTYLRWGDPWFWDKLHCALPPPRAAPAPPPAALLAPPSALPQPHEPLPLEPPPAPAPAPAPHDAAPPALAPPAPAPLTTPCA